MSESFFCVHHFYYFSKKICLFLVRYSASCYLFCLKQVKRLMKDLLLGIDFLHQKNIVHRDIKTSNLLYSNQGILKICDFGLARKISPTVMTQ